MKTVTNAWGTKVNYEIAKMMMDDEIREKLHAEIAPCMIQTFFDAYCAAHEEKFGTEFELAKPNPCY